MLFPKLRWNIFFWDAFPSLSACQINPSSNQQAKFLVPEGKNKKRVWRRTAITLFFSNECCSPCSFGWEYIKVRGYNFHAEKWSWKAHYGWRILNFWASFSVQTAPCVSLKPLILVWGKKQVMKHRTAAEKVKKVSLSDHLKTNINKDKN